MARPEFEDLPFFERPDLTPYLIHLTKNSRSENGSSAFDNLVNILKHGKVWASTSSQGFIKGPNPATCFMDVPFYALKYILNKKNTDPDNPRYEPFGIFVTKKYAYNHGCRPVLYLSNREVQDLRIPEDELWRVVRFEVSAQGWVSWLHEREWRCKDSFLLPTEPLGVLVKNTSYIERLKKKIANASNKFQAIPKSIIPLSVLCQGLPQL